MPKCDCLPACCECQSTRQDQEITYPEALVRALSIPLGPPLRVEKPDPDGSTVYEYDWSAKKIQLPDGFIQHKGTKGPG